MAVTVNADGALQVYNALWLQIDGQDTPLNGLCTTISYSTGTESSHVQAITTDGYPVDVNAINCSPTGTIIFNSASTLNRFKLFLNNRIRFNLIFREFRVGSFADSGSNLQLSNCMISETSMSASQGSPSNTISLNFVFTKPTWI
jgi:hypothetical protein